MEKKQEIFSEMPKIIIGELITGVVLFFCFWGFQKLDFTVLWGFLLGAATNVLNFAILCLAVEKMLRDQDPKAARSTQLVSYFIRMGILALALVLAIKNDLFNPIATAVPLLMTRPILTVTSLLFHKKEGKN